MRRADISPISRRLSTGVLMAGAMTAGWLVVAVEAAPRAKPPAQETAAQVDALWRELLTEMGDPPDTAAEWTRAAYVAARWFRYGTNGVPAMGRRFARAHTPEQAFLAGVYLAVHGGRTERWFVRRELESDKRKQAWLKNYFGNARRVTDTFDRGLEWEPALKFLPSTVNGRLLVRHCLDSKDVLVRRAALTWGYWIADDRFWRKAEIIARRDPDALTRRFAAVLIKRAAARRN